MSRTEELKKILKPGMRVKLKETTEGNWPEGLPDNQRMDEWLGAWTEVTKSPYYDDRHFLKVKTSLEGMLLPWPLTMIEKVERVEEAEGEEGEIITVEGYHESTSFAKDDDTIPVPRGKVKEELRHVNKSAISESSNGVLLLQMKKMFGDDLIDTLLQEIEEEEKYVEVCGLITEIRGSSQKPVASMDFHKRQTHIEVWDGYVPEIHKEGGGFVVKFKREG